MNTVAHFDPHHHQVSRQAKQQQTSAIASQPQFLRHIHSGKIAESAGKESRKKVYLPFLPTPKDVLQEQMVQLSKSGRPSALSNNPNSMYNQYYHANMNQSK
jgi:hypothetical protein